MQNNKSIGYDQTKKMLNTLRKLNEDTKSKSIIREQQEMKPEVTQNIKNDIIVINNVDVKLNSSDNLDLKLTEEQKTAISNIIDAFKQQVSDLAEFEPGMSVNRDQIRLDGVISNLDIKFTVVAGKEAGPYINCDMTEITEELVQLLTKFQKFYLIYTDAMNNLINERKNN